MVVGKNFHITQISYTPKRDLSLTENETKGESLFYF